MCLKCTLILLPQYTVIFLVITKTINCTRAFDLNRFSMLSNEMCEKANVCYGCNDEGNTLSTPQY